MKFGLKISWAETFWRKPNKDTKYIRTPLDSELDVLVTKKGG